MDVNFFPQNMLQDIWNLSEQKIPVSVTRDVISGVYYALSTLSEREQYILWECYHNQRSLTDISSCLSISPERVRQIKMKALRKFRDTSRFRYIRYGVAGYIRKKSADAYHQGYLTGYEKGLADGRNSTEECALPPEMMNLPIQYLNLSVRPYNCLYRSGYEYIRDIVSLTKEEIFKIRNLGRFGANEIAKALCDRGILDSEWNHYLFCDD